VSKPRLGKGLQALITDMSPTGADEVQQIAVDLIVPNPYQPRRAFAEEELAELAASIRQHGLIQPVTVRPRSGRYELVVGERRWRAAKLAGLTEIPALVKEWSDREAMEVALVENLQREDLNPMEEAAAFAQLQRHLGVTQESLAERVGKSRPYVANALRLLTLSPAVAELVSRGTISAGHARAILSAPEAKRELLAREVAAEGLTVREAERLAARAAENVSRETTVRPAKAKLPWTELQEVERELQGALQTRVELKGSPERGTVVITYHSAEELERLREWLLRAGG
jgi:ParB family chromosome partitioning protein